MSPLIAISITTGIFSMLWASIAEFFDLIGWVGFLGSTSYFASPGGSKALVKTIFCNVSGMLWALLLINISLIWSVDNLYYSLLTGIIALLMCIQARLAFFNYTHGTFTGCCATFALAGEWELILPSIIIGVVFGYIMKTSGLLLSNSTQKMRNVIMRRDGEKL
ncbi:DUF1097 domain-containing protein [Aeromonas hydrophila]|uniref:DUF1097 domain-containing protein n=1 Tax=Aeromonas hydrophila TaxID=644 RepID=UPI0009B7E8C8|nr:DUF1097 domain-containing protein [Aeromonas hydrophila]